MCARFTPAPRRQPTASRPSTSTTCALRLQLITTMAPTPPFSRRPALRLALTPITTTPEPYRPSSPYHTPLTPLDSNSYSPFHSASLRAPQRTGDASGHAQRSPGSCVAHYSRTAFARLLVRRTLFLALAIASLILWWDNGARHDLSPVALAASGMRTPLLRTDAISGLQFFPASNPKFHVCVALARCHQPS